MLADIYISLKNTYHNFPKSFLGYVYKILWESYCKRELKRLSKECRPLAKSLNDYSDKCEGVVPWLSRKNALKKFDRKTGKLMENR